LNLEAVSSSLNRRVTPFKHQKKILSALTLASLLSVLAFYGASMVPVLTNASTAVAEEKDKLDGPRTVLAADATGASGLSEDSAAAKTTLFDELKTFADVLSIVQQDYVRPIDNKRVVEGAIRGMLTTLDPHSGYLDPDFYRDLQVQTKGEFGGLGIEINVRDETLVVVSPMEGSPAAAAGVRPGDVIVKIDGKFTKDMALVEAVKRLRGIKGSAVKLAIARKGVSQLLDISVVRDIIQVKSVKSRNLGDGFGYLRINQFAEHTSDDMRASLKSLRSQHRGELKGLVLDLRNNPGGLLNQAVEVSDVFLKDGVIVYTDGRDPSQRHNFYAHERGTEPDYPLVVLVNGGSASAAEIVSGALQDAARGLIVGTQTFGKGSVQTIMPLANGGAVTLTTALYYTKSGRSIQVTGVKPDVIVEARDVETRQSTSSMAREKKQKIGEPLMREGDLPGAIANPAANPIIESSPLNFENKGTPENTGSSEESENNLPVLNPLKSINQIDDEQFKPIDIEQIAISDWVNRDLQFGKALEILKRDAA